MWSSSGKTPVSKKSRPSYSADIKLMLHVWLFQNMWSPYPSENEKSELVIITGLTKIQVNNWMINARRRILPKMVNGTLSVDDIFKKFGFQ